MLFSVVGWTFILLLCIAASRLSGRFGVPALLIFIGVGIVFGIDGVFKIPFADYALSEQICSFALIFIMFYGGFGTNWQEAKPVALKALSLSTLGVVVTALVTGLFCWKVLAFPPLESLLIGSVISSTDAASVFSILRSKKLDLKEGTSSLLQLESGSNDPASYMLTITALTLLEGGGLGSVMKMMFSQVVYGIALGALVAWAAVWVLKHLSFEIEGFDALFVLAVAVLSYSLPTYLGGNGYLAAYLAGILMGNSAIPNKKALVPFFDGITGLAQILIFFLLGLLSYPSQLPQYWGIAVSIALFLTFVARPAAVFLLLTPLRCPLRQQLLVCWSGLRGAASIVFAIMAIVNGSYHGDDLFHIVFFVSILSVACQGTLLPLCARWLGMVQAEGGSLKTFTDYQEAAQMQLIQTHIPARHPWIGQTVEQLSPVLDLLIVLIVRGGRSIFPNGATAIEEGDLLVLSGEVYRQEERDIQLTEVFIGKKHPWAGRALAQVALPPQSLVVSIRRPDGSTQLPKGQTLVEAGDTLVIGRRRSAAP